MYIDTKSIEDKIFQELSVCSTLSEYIKSFTKGGLGFTRKIFPFIDLGDLSYRATELRASSCTLEYNVDIFVGVRSIVPGIAFEGSESGAKGVVQICEDVRSILARNTFSSAFITPVYNIGVNPRFIYDAAETTFVGKVSFSGSVWLFHTT